METESRRSVRPFPALALIVAATVATGCRSAAPTQATQGTPHNTIDWTRRLPACPCRQPDPKALADGWALDRRGSLKHHPGAGACVRSYPPVRTEVGRSGQQCCYDHDGSLVTSGSAAGTPDRATSCGGERRNGRMTVRPFAFVSHVFKDVRPWAPRYRKWESYNAWWPPDNSNQCPLLHVVVGDRNARALGSQEPGASAPRDGAPSRGPT